jgi:signal transduction histidine kinase
LSRTRSLSPVGPAGTVVPTDHEITAMSSPSELLGVPPMLRRAARRIYAPTPRYVALVLCLGLAYFTVAKLGQTLRYTASVSAIWPPVGLGIAALYLGGLRWWPGILVGELLVNAELLLGDSALPVGSVLGQQCGNLAEVIVGAVLLRRLIGPDARLDRVAQVGGMAVALVAAVAISATVGTVSMLAGGVIDANEVPTFWRTWVMGDFAGGLVGLSLALAWAPDPGAAWRRIRGRDGVLVLTAVVSLSVIAVSFQEPLTYLVFPALIWAAFRFGPPGATLAIGIATLVTIAITANEVGPFFQQTIDHRTLATQAFVVITALTTLFLSALVCEREQAAKALAEARRREGERAVEERHRIARDLHDSVSQSLFSAVLQARTAQRQLRAEGVSPAGPVGQALGSIADLTRSVQAELRTLIHQLDSASLDDGLVAALELHAARVHTDVAIAVQATGTDLVLAPDVELQLFAIAREALSNVIRHSGARRASLQVHGPPGPVVLEVRDDGRGFDPAIARPGHFGLQSMRSRAAEAGALLTITSAPGRGTVVRVEAAVEHAA